MKQHTIHHNQLNQKSPWKWVPTLYFSEGLPNILVAEISVLMYQQLGLSNELITFYTSWFYLPWVLKPFWSPLVELLKTKRWWIIAMELLLGASFAAMAFSIPTTFWLQSTICLFWIIAFSSATHDIAADGFYMLGLSEHDQALFNGIRNTFYKIASIFGKGFLVFLAGSLQVLFRWQIRFSWSIIFYIVSALFIAVYLYHIKQLPTPKKDKNINQKDIKRIGKDLIETISSFFKKPYIVTTILFLLLYRFPEALLSKVSILFLTGFKHTGGLGLSPQEFSLVYGTVGVIGLLGGGIIGGYLVSKDGLKKWLWPMVIAITVPDAVYIYLSYYQVDALWLINTSIFIEQFGYGFGFTAYTVYMLYFCRGQFQTSHYAICTGFMAASMMLPGMISGRLQSILGYQNFFIFVLITCIITFIVTYFIKIDNNFGKKRE